MGAGGEQPRAAGAVEPSIGSSPSEAANTAPLESSAWLRRGSGPLPSLVALPLLGLVSWLLPAHGESYLVYVAGLAGISVVLAVSLNVVNGFTGQFSLGHAGFMAVGGYAAALITISFGDRYQLAFLPEAASDGLLFLGATLLGGLAAAAVGLLVGLPSLRLRGDYLAIVTLGAGEIIRVILENLQSLGGATGLNNIPPYTNLFWIFFWAVAVVVVSKRLVGSTHGRALLAVREDEIAAEAMGIDTTRYKVLAFVIAAFFAGVAGALFGHYLLLLSPKEFTWVRSFEVVAMIVLGGLGSISGAVIAAILLTILPEALRPVQDLTGVDFRMVIYASLLVVMMLLRPQGLLGRREVWELRRSRGTSGGGDGEAAVASTSLEGAAPRSRR